MAFLEILLRVYKAKGSFSPIFNLLPISRTLLVKSVMPAIGVAMTATAVSNASRRFLS
ncbi:MAG: hypothetical protein ACK5EU_01945 [Pseudanabaena sp.]|uniref:hypothetical protein n=1 Tax=Pseudanabaena mucicola TaxID=71190 RepID=UPI002576710F|nr:hypothetical protein [Pseudanabaena mucicola]MCE2977742.1 hypothetical protein [Pseudanabaena sp. CoA8_M7]